VERPRGGRRGDRVRVSRIRPFENRTIVVPNSELGTTALVSHDDKDRVKVVIPVGVGYGEDLAS
jgi:small conductance mechanosensitive channel